MKYSTKELVALYDAIYLEEEKTEIELAEFEVMKRIFDYFGETVTWSDLSDFTPYLDRWFPDLGYITTEILRSASENGIFPINKIATIKLSEDEIKFYTALAKRHVANVKMFE